MSRYKKPWIQDDDSRVSMSDVELIQKEFAQNGHYVSREDAAWAWQQVSDSYEATWLCADCYEGSLFEMASRYLEEN